MRCWRRSGARARSRRSGLPERPMPLTAAELEPLLRLSLVQGVGPQRLARLIARFGGAEGAIGARPRDLQGVPGIGGELAARIRAAGGPASRAATAVALRRLDDLGAVAITPADPEFPAPFRDVPEPPFLLFAAGRLELLRVPSVAVVGTRSPTHHGRAAAEELSHDLARSGLAIVSGAARGIDTAAHRGALAAGGGTVAVLGNGIEQVYPPENATLFAAIRRQGLLLTEYPPGETPRAGNFPRRNRLIAALCLGVLVVEMGHRSGAQHTVGFALEMGKEVMAVPGPIRSHASAGSNQLIRDGAPLVTSAADVIEELWGVGSRPPPGLRGGAGPSAPGAGPPAASPAPLLSPPLPSPLLDLLTDAERRLLAALEPGDRHVDEIASAARMPTREALATLLELEVRGLAISLPGMRYARARSDLPRVPG
jgi:DNA processing protein